MMTSKPLKKFLIFAITSCVVSSATGCSTLIPVPEATIVATEIATPTKTTVPSATTASTSEPSPTPYNGPNILYYVRDDNYLFSIHADGSNPEEIAQGVLFTISPDKKKIIYRTAETYASNQDEMIVLDVEQKKIVFKWHIPGYCEGFFMSSRFAWSPDSQKIAFILVRYDLVDPSPDCELEYHYEDMGIYQIDLTSATIIHPPIDAYDYSLSASDLLVYSPDSSKLRIEFRGPAFDADTLEPVALEPFYDLLQLGNPTEKVGICGSNLCLYDQNDKISKRLTKHEKSWEGAETFKLFPNSSAVVYQTQEYELHLLSLINDTDEIIGNNVWDYFITPDNDKIVFYERDRFAEDGKVFVVNGDGSKKYSIVEFPQRHAPVRGPLLMLSPTGDKAAFVNSDGIDIIDLDDNNLLQLVNLPDGAPNAKVSLEILAWY